ncbi:MAG: hypothetical protein BRD40_03955 [Bacteroidetes bacterium QS_1_65_9]|nr:MAG: hypothetical protein BRD40_03955 [Bacteroidetes bacterium QS_1_65_9]
MPPAPAPRAPPRAPAMPRPAEAPAPTGAAPCAATLRGTAVRAYRRSCPFRAFSPPPGRRERAKRPRQGAHRAWDERAGAWRSRSLPRTTQERKKFTSRGRATETICSASESCPLVLVIRPNAHTTRQKWAFALHVIRIAYSELF